MNLITTAQNDWWVSWGGGGGGGVEGAYGSHLESVCMKLC